MYDPQTVAFAIKRPWPSRRQHAFMGRRWSWPTLVTIWHVDPERSSRLTGNRSDDSCGWFHPPVSEAERERIAKLGREQYSTIFRKRECTQRGEGYASVCYEPTTYDAVYWAWRRIKHSQSRWYRWNYGPTRGHGLSQRELAEIQSLASNPVDNAQSMVARVQSEDDCAEFFGMVNRAYLRLHRPWYRKPKWHVHHWKLQIHPLQAFKRWAFSRCAGCQKRFSYSYSPVTAQWDGTGPLWFRSETGIYHSQCMPQGPSVVARTEA